MEKFKNTIFLSGKKHQLYRDISNNTLTIYQGLQEQYQYILTQTNGSCDNSLIVQLKFQDDPEFEQDYEMDL